MTADLVHAKNWDFAVPIIACKAQGTAICHRKAECSTCAFALAKLNPDQPLYFLMKARRK